MSSQLWCMYLWVCMCMWVCMHVCVWMCMHVCMCIYVYACVCECICMCMSVNCSLQSFPSLIHISISFSKIHLHFKCYPICLFLPSQTPRIPSTLLLWECSPTHSYTPASLSLIPQHWNIYQTFIEPRTFAPIDAWQGHPLLYTQLEPCVLLGWWLSPWELWGSACLILLFFLWDGKPLQLLGSFL